MLRILLSLISFNLWSLDSYANFVFFELFVINRASRKRLLFLGSVENWERMSGCQGRTCF